MEAPDTVITDENFQPQPSSGSASKKRNTEAHESKHNRIPISLDKIFCISKDELTLFQLS